MKYHIFHRTVRMAAAFYDLNYSSVTDNSPVKDYGNDTFLSSHLQATDVKTRKTMFIDSDASRILWTGYSTGRCIAQWKKSNESSEPFEETCRLPVRSDPYDLCEISAERFAASFANGDIVYYDTSNCKIQELGRKQAVHGDGNARVLALNENKIISGSSSGSIIIMDIESGEKQILPMDYSGVSAMTVLTGGSLLATGHEAGQLLIWDMRDPNTFSQPSTATPSKRSLDAITALAAHPAQSNLIAFGTDDGGIGFCDVRGAGSELLPTLFDVFVSTVTKIGFHPQCGEHLVCSSLDGCLNHWDASHVNMGGFRSSASSRQSVWTNDRLGDAVNINTLRSKSFGGVNGFDIVGKNVVAAYDMMSIAVFEGVSFPIASS
ncbi:unnamed protein product [Auanema sp. JU1783]|nr:unnamed protein product [Auanema sp. JU1783]